MEDNQTMNSSTKQLYLFWVTCSGNWRNSIYIKYQKGRDASGYLLADGTVNRSF